MTLDLTCSTLVLYDSTWTVTVLACMVLYVWPLCGRMWVRFVRYVGVLCGRRAVSVGCVVVALCPLYCVHDFALNL
jgi:hypothetical protein